MRIPSFQIKLAEHVFQLHLTRPWQIQPRPPLRMYCKAMGGERKVAWLSEVHRSFSRTGEPAKPRIRNIRTELFRSHDSFSLSSDFSWARASARTRVRPVWSRMLPEDYRTPEWRRRRRFSRLFSLFLLLTDSSSFRRLRGRCVIRGINLGPSEATRVITNAPRIRRNESPRAQLHQKSWRISETSCGQSDVRLLSHVCCHNEETSFKFHPCLRKCSENWRTLVWAK